MRFFKYLRFLSLKVKYHFTLYGRLFKLIDYSVKPNDDFIFKMSDDGHAAVLSISTYPVMDTESVGSVWIFIQTGCWKLLRQLLPKNNKNNLYFGAGLDISQDGKRIAISTLKREDVSTVPSVDVSVRYPSSGMKMGTGAVTIYDQFTYTDANGIRQTEYKFHSEILSTDYDNDSGFGKYLAFSRDGQLLAIAVPEALLFGIRLGEIVIYRFDGLRYHPSLKIRGQLAFSNFGRGMYFSNDGRYLICNHLNHWGKTIRVPYEINDSETSGEK